MSRKVNLEQGRKDVEWVLERYGRDIRSKKAQAILRTILLGVEESGGPEMANSIIVQYDLSRPYYGSQDWFEDGNDHPHVIHLDPNFKIPDEWRIFPGDKRHPGTIRINLKGEKYYV